MLKVLVPMEIHQDNPLIGIHGARPTYIEKLIKNNLMPIFISPLSTQKMINEAYNMTSGVYFIGGEDWNPALYGQKKHPKTFVGEPERDKIELPILKRALKDKKPFLGLCRGSQGLAIATGGTLMQHVPDAFPTENHNPNKTYDDLLTSARHDILIDPTSKAYKIMKIKKTKVNSYHHQAVDTVGNTLRVAAKSPAGVTEIIEHIDPNYFCMGFECHPEADKNGPFEKIFAEFAKEIKKYAKFKKTI